MWSSLEWQAWITLGIIFFILMALIKEIARPEMIFLSALGLLLTCGVLTPEEAFSGFSNTAVLTVGALFVVAVGVQNTGALNFTDRLLFKRSATLAGVLARMMVTTAAMSAFLNNTPIVAMLIPRAQAWSEESNVAPSKLLIPLSYAAIVGGMTTLIGTSTNLLVSGLMVSSGYEGLGLFDLTWVGLPTALGAIAYFTLIGHRFLPNRQQLPASESELEHYLFEVRVAFTSSLDGKTVEQAGLRSLGDAYLVHIFRNSHFIPSAPDLRLRACDILTFRGSLSMLDKLLKVPGIERAFDGLDTRSETTMPLFEAVVAPSSLLVGRTLRDVRFREHFHGIVLGIQRRDTQIEGSLGTVEIQPGDLLLIEAPPGFDRRWNGRRSDFYLVASRHPGRVRPQRRKAPLALFILIGVVLLAAVGVAPIVTTAFVGALLMLLTRCISGWEARRSIDFPVLFVIASALGVGRAIETTGLAEAIAHTLIGAAAAFGTIGVLVAVYLTTSILTEFITNNAAAALMIGIGLAAARDLNAAPEAFAIAVAIAASASFLTPIGYQTNLMVMAAGGYRFSDYFRAGIFLNLIVATIAISVISLLWL
ncbi:MAG: SLC13 family permease [Anaerolineales bacterium]|nr:SLC13 family permease [Anaerolineales bacterium]